MALQQQQISQITPENGTGQPWLGLARSRHDVSTDQTRKKAKTGPRSFAHVESSVAADGTGVSLGRGLGCAGGQSVRLQGPYMMYRGLKLGVQGL